MKCQLAVYLGLYLWLLVNCGVIKRDYEDPAKIASDQEIRNSTGIMASFLVEILVIIFMASPSPFYRYWDKTFCQFLLAFRWPSTKQQFLIWHLPMLNRCMMFAWIVLEITTIFSTLFALALFYLLTRECNRSKMYPWKRLSFFPMASSRFFA